MAILNEVVDDTTHHVTTPLRKPPASADVSPQSVALELRVSDYDSVVELLQKPEGRERDEYALIALRIGLLSLKHARGQIDADLVTRVNAPSRERSPCFCEITFGLTVVYEMSSWA